MAQLIYRLAGLFCLYDKSITFVVNNENNKAMQISQLFQLMGGDGSPGLAVYDYVMKQYTRQATVTEAIKQYIPSLHDVAKKEKRPDKTIYVVTGVDDQQKPVYGTNTAPVSRAPIGIQEYIISQKGSFARGNGVSLRPSDENSNIFKRVSNNWAQNKTDFDLKEIAVRQMSETQVAVIFYGEQGKKKLDDFRFKYKIVSPLKGDKLFPFFDEDTDDLIAFGREFKRDKDTMFDLYLMNQQGYCEIWKYKNKKPKLVISSDKQAIQENANATEHEIIKTVYNKLPIVYWEQNEGECNSTNELSKELETGFNDFLSGLGYTADPILFAKGKTMDLPAKGTQGKFIETDDPDGDLKFVTPDNATEARNLEFKMLQKYIFSLNRAVLLDLETMKELGAMSGAALERYLIDCYMDATDRQQGSWGKGVQRMVNWLTAQWQLLEARQEPDLRIDVVFSKYSLQDEMEKVTLATTANGGNAVVDIKTSIKIAGLVDNDSVDKTYDLIKQENPKPVSEPVTPITE